MTPEQALQILRQFLVVRQGLTLEQVASLLVAWNVMVEATKKEQTGTPVTEAGYLA